MLNIAIVEDENEYVEQIQGYISEYEKKYSHKIKVTIFNDGSKILENYSCIYDIIFLDIELPEMNGMDIAKRIREYDTDVVIIFITNMAQYAIHGYAVGALDFILKPVNYSTFSVRFTRAINRVKRRESRQILLTMPDAVQRLDTGQIYYVEIQSRILHYHTALGEYVLRGTLQSAENVLKDYHFVRCSNWCLVNLKHVSEIRRDIVIVADDELAISRRNKKAFLTALTDYVGGNA